MKKLIFAILILILLFPVSVFGHTNLTSSNPEEGEVVTEVLETVQLDFGTSIEEGSTMNLESETESIEFDQVEVSGQSMSGTLSEELPNGAYTINWNIIGEDGHPIEGKIPFAVDIEAAEAEEEPSEEPVEEPVEEPAEESADDSSAAEESSSEQESAADAAAEEETGSNLLVTILLVIAFILLVFGLFKLFGKKR